MSPEIIALDATSAGLLAALGRQSLYAALALGLALIAARLLRRAPARVHAALWALVLVRLLLPPDLSAPWSARSLLGIGALGGEAPAATVLVAEPAGLAPVPRIGSTAAATAPAPAPEAPALPWSLLATAGWIAGVLAVAGRLAWRRRSFRRIAREAPPVTDPWVLARFDAMRRELRIGRPVRLVSGAAAAPAFTLGVLRPVVHLPARFLRAGSPRTAVDAALAHELAHVAALDDLQLRLRGIAYALFFFHPAAWWASIRHAESRELAADERVVASGVLTPRAYGRGFLAALRLDSTHGQPGPSAALAAPAQAADRRGLAKRMERIHATQNPRAGRWVRYALLAAALRVLPMAQAEMGADMGPETAVDPTLDLAVPAPAPAAPAPEGAGLASLPTLPPPVMTSFAPPLAAAAPSPLAPAPAPAPAFMSPVPDARVTSPYGDRWNPVKSRQDHHNGVDLAADEGTPVRAADAGIVRVATTRYEEGADWGTVVVVEHSNGYQTFHAHLGSLSVTPGQRVVRGDELGTVGATGRVTGPHLHWGVALNRAMVDPGLFLDGE